MMHHYRGLAYAGLGNYDRALTDYAQAIAQDGLYAPTYLSRALVYAELGQIADAEADLETYIELDGEIDADTQAILNEFGITLPEA